MSQMRLRSHICVCVDYRHDALFRFLGCQVVDKVPFGRRLLDLNITRSARLHGSSSRGTNLIPPRSLRCVANTYRIKFVQRARTFIAYRLLICAVSGSNWSHTSPIHFDVKICSIQLAAFVAGGRGDTFGSNAVTSWHLLTSIRTYSCTYV